ncbi:uncharacterized protein [Macaca nemestrina]|uniref:uncharacterized protein n=1 Tax=Macaca nemestrina TaxID=9545 RepID=UPI0039B98347
MTHSVDTIQPLFPATPVILPWAYEQRIHWSYHVSHHRETVGLIEQWSGLVRSQLKCQLGDSTLQSWGKVFQKAVYALNQRSIYGTVSPIAKIHWSRNQGVEVEVAPLTITLSDPLEKFLLPVPVTLYSAGLKVLVSEGGILPPGDTTIISLNWKLRLPPGHFVLFLPLSQQAKKGVTVLAGVTWTIKMKSVYYSTLELRKLHFPAHEDLGIGTSGQQNKYSLFWSCDINVSIRIYLHKQVYVYKI